MPLDDTAFRSIEKDEDTAHYVHMCAVNELVMLQRKDGSTYGNVKRFIHESGT